MSSIDIVKCTSNKGIILKYQRGSEWRKWDLHFHTPSSYDYKDKSISNQDIIDKLYDNNIAVVAITDHHIIDIDRIKELQKLGENKVTVLPGIEFLSETRGKQPIHFIAIFDEKSKIDYIWDQIKNITNIKKIYGEGKNQNEVYCQLEDTIKIVHTLGGIITIHAGDKHSSIENITHSLPHSEAQKTDIARMVDIYELGKERDKEGYIKNVFPAIKQYIPMIICSDNHDIKNYKLKQNCWIKANPTFNGLLQALNEPQDRFFIGETPQKNITVALNKHKYIDSILVKKTSISTEKNIWFDCEIPLNPNLVAIIGNKGNGKSALSDIVALTGNAKVISQDDFSFLNTKRFKKNGLAKNFKASLVWSNNQKSECNLNDDIQLDENEKVKYLPQKYIEKICTEENYETFQEEINKVVFSHINDVEKLNKDNLKDLIKEKTDSLRNRRNEYKKNLQDNFEKTIELENKYNNQEMKKIRAQLSQIISSISEHQKYKKENIKEVKSPADDTTIADEQKEKFKEINKLSENIKNNQQQLLDSKTSLQKLILVKNFLEKILEHIKLQITKFKSFKTNIQNEAENLEIEFDVNKFINISFEEKYLIDKIDKINEKILNTNNEITATNKSLEEYTKSQEKLNTELNEVQKAYQNYLEKLNIWNIKLKELDNEKIKVEEKINFKKNKMPTALKELRQDIHKNFKNIYATYEEELNIYQELYKPILEFVRDEKENVHANKGFIEFTSNIVLNKRKLYDNIMEYFHKGRMKFDKQDVKEIIDVLDDVSLKNIFVLQRKIELTINKNKEINKQFRDYKQLQNFYLELWGLDYLEVQYDIKMDRRGIEQLSPGERGALLIIFYLLIDKGDIPLIIDQPEDNLDNESVFEYLVPYIKQAKQRRQIIIVTHNPNIAVVSDAEQIIYTEIDKADKNKITYLMGAIESKEISNKIIEVLEGTMPAFANRKNKYNLST